MRLHFIRHGEVYNPEHVLYERLDGFHLSTKGKAMAEITAEFIKVNMKNPVALYSSPLTRTVETATAISRATGLEVQTDERILEAKSRLRGKKLSPITLLRNTLKIIDYRTPSWGEPYAKIENRMRSAVDSALSKYGANDDILFVSHQSPIYILQRSLTGKKLHHNPIARFTRLCSITTFEFDAEKNFISFEYVEPAAALY